jgi:hypothetical protein
LRDPDGSPAGPFMTEAEALAAFQLLGFVVEREHG